MTLNQTAEQAGDLVAPLRSPQGGFAMLALDQRASLRRMFPVVDGREADDDALRSFKQTAARILTPYASAVLLDRPYAVTERRPEEVAPDCALILAADVLHQPPGQPVLDTTLDTEVTAAFIRQVGAVAIKLLVIWRPDGHEERRAELVRSFLAVAREAGVASLVEAVSQPRIGETWDTPASRQQAVLDAAREIAPLGGSVYKAQVPGYLPGDVSAVRAFAETLSEIVAMPWVVLSNGVEQDDFAPAVRQACLGGAHGFLAGRAIWADTVADPDPAGALAGRSTQRLRALADIVAETRKP
ncbi:aldolase [Mangrovihabitans endophyticus]|uniref:Aldolase n=1 Tax=Mangrovihabitans endophyticus TaxID=1751298 RepID=A0A8J3FM75_9ACTN|nr:aldolase [Mangrovihabitans endophyticus]GGK81579.1 aldolase [Mangrovihabitans endophyticus]